MIEKRTQKNSPCDVLIDAFYLLRFKSYNEHSQFMKTLPNELLCLIFKHCDDQSLLALSQTSKRFYNIITKSIELYGKLTLIFKEDVSRSSYAWNSESNLIFLKSMLENGRKFIKIKIEAPVFIKDGCQTTFLADLKEIFNEFENPVLTLKLSNVNFFRDPDMINIFMLMPNVENIECIDVVRLSQTNIYECMYPEFMNLKNLKIVRTIK